MGTLKSQAFADDPKLEACAVSDPAHIMPGTVGPHVGKIQAALTSVGQQTIDAAELGQSRYGSSTSAAVRQFKQARKILNYAGQIDEIVGKKTIAALDQELKAKEGPSPAPPTPDKGDEAQIMWARSQALQCIGV